MQVQLAGALPRGQLALAPSLRAVLGLSSGRGASLLDSVDSRSRVWAVVDGRVPYVLHELLAQFLQFQTRFLVRLLQGLDPVPHLLTFPLE